MGTPAPLPVLAGVYYAQVTGEAGGKKVENIFTFFKSGLALGDPADAANAALVALEVSVAYGNLVSDASAGLNAAYIGQDVKVYALGSPTLPAVTHALTAGGSDTSTLQPLFACAVIKHTVARRGRGSQSVTHYSPISDNSVAADGKAILGGFQTALQIAFDAFTATVLSGLAAGSPGSWSYVQLSKFHNKVYAPAVYPIMASTVDALLGTDRRRGAR